MDAIKKYVEGGGRALFMLDPPLKLGRRQIGDNQALSDLLESWGVTADKNLLLDESAASQLLGGGPEAPVIMQYDSHPIVNDLTNISTAFPLSRSLETKNTDKTTITKLFSTSTDSFATTNLSSAEIRIDPAKDKHGPFTLAVAGTYNTGKPAGQGRFVVVGNSGLGVEPGFGLQREPQSLAEHHQLAFVRRGLDLHPSRSARRSPHHIEPRPIPNGADLQPVLSAA